MKGGVGGVLEKEARKGGQRERKSMISGLKSGRTFSTSNPPLRTFFLLPSLPSYLPSDDTWRPVFTEEVIAVFEERIKNKTGKYAGIGNTTSDILPLYTLEYSLVMIG